MKKLRAVSLAFAKRLGELLLEGFKSLWQRIFWGVSWLRCFMVFSFVGVCVVVAAAPMFSFDDPHGATFWTLNPWAVSLITALGLQAYIFLEAIVFFIFAVAVLMRTPHSYSGILIFFLTFLLCGIKFLGGLWNLYLISHF